MTRFLMILFFSFISQSLLASEEFIENIAHENSLQTILKNEFGSTDYRLVEKMEKGFSVLSFENTNGTKELKIKNPAGVQGDWKNIFSWTFI